jgi:hypothetical protein
MTVSFINPYPETEHECSKLITGPNGSDHTFDVVMLEYSSHDLVAKMGNKDIENPQNIPPFIKPRPPDNAYRQGAVRRPARALKELSKAPDPADRPLKQLIHVPNPSIVEARYDHQAFRGGLTSTQAISSASPATPAAVNWGNFFQSPQHTPSPER